MGGSQSTAHLFIAVENNRILPGQDFSCVAHLLLNKKVKSPSLEITFLGEELVRFQGDGIKTGKNRIIEFKSSLLAHDSKDLSPGSYSFPFVVEIPKGIPGTFKADMKRFEASIQYKIKAELKERRETIVDNKTEVFIEQAFETNRYSTLTTHAGTVVCCDCFNKGICTITAHVDKNAYLPQETAKMRIEINNSLSRRALQGLGIMLWRVIRLISTTNEVGLFKKCIYSTNIQVNVQSGVKLLSGKEITLEIPIYSKEIDLDQCASTLGKVVQCRYFIEISTDFGKCMSRVVDFEVPLIISPKVLLPQAPSAPEDWNPIEMPPTRMSSEFGSASIIE